MKPNIRAHFRAVDPTLFAALSALDGQAHLLVPRISKDYFSDLCEAIINQQLSEKAGATIFKRFRRLFPKEIITPTYVSETRGESIRSVGVSWSKVKYIKALAENVIRKEIRLETLTSKTDTEVIAELTRIQGIGPWTAEMFLMFSLGREDVFSYGDVGLRRAIQKLYKFKREPTQKQMEKITKKWSPYRTYACRILWRTLDDSITIGI